MTRQLLVAVCLLALVGCGSSAKAGQQSGTIAFGTGVTDYQHGQPLAATGVGSTFNIGAKIDLVAHLTQPVGSGVTLVILRQDATGITSLGSVFRSGPPDKTATTVGFPLDTSTLQPGRYTIRIQHGNAVIASGNVTLQ